MPRRKTTRAMSATQSIAVSAVPVDPPFECGGRLIRLRQTAYHGYTGASKTEPLVQPSGSSVVRRYAQDNGCRTGPQIALSDGRKQRTAVTSVSTLWDHIQLIDFADLTTKLIRPKPNQQC